MSDSPFSQAIREALSRPADVRCVPVTGSTNDDLKAAARRCAFTMPTLLTAERQTAGRGTRGRTWNPVRQSLIFSLGLRLTPALLQIAPGLMSIAVAMSCARALSRVSVRKVSVKWPNDVWADGKAGGILLETVRDNAGRPSLIVGIGLNLEVEPGGRTGGGWPVAALGLRVNPRDRLFKGELLGMIVGELLDDIAALESPGAVTRLASEWPLYDAFYGREVSWRELDSGRTARGFDRGIDAEGRLMMLGSHGELRFLSGELVSLSAMAAALN